MTHRLARVPRSFDSAITRLRQPSTARSLSTPLRRSSLGSSTSLTPSAHSQPRTFDPRTLIPFRPHSNPQLPRTCEPSSPSQPSDTPIPRYSNFLTPRAPPPSSPPPSNPDSPLPQFLEPSMPRSPPTAELPILRPPPPSNARTADPDRPRTPPPNPAPSILQPRSPRLFTPPTLAPPQAPDPDLPRPPFLATPRLSIPRHPFHPSIARSLDAHRPSPRSTTSNHLPPRLRYLRVILEERERTGNKIDYPISQREEREGVNMK